MSLQTRQRWERRNAQLLGIRPSCHLVQPSLLQRLAHRERARNAIALLERGGRREGDEGRRGVAGVLLLERGLLGLQCSLVHRCVRSAEGGAG